MSKTTITPKEIDAILAEVLRVATEIGAEVKQSGNGIYYFTVKGNQCRIYVTYLIRSGKWRVCFPYPADPSTQSRFSMTETELFEFLESKGAY